MALLVWVMVGLLAIWHFTIFPAPIASGGGIVGAFVGALLGSSIFGLIINGFSVPGRHDTHLATALEGIPGVLIGLGGRVVLRNPPGASVRPRTLERFFRSCCARLTRR